MHRESNDSSVPMLRSKLTRQEWQDDGHRVLAVMHYDSVHLRIECPGEGCKLDRCACGDCEGSGCPTCNDTGQDPPRPGFCWLRDMAPEMDFIEAFYVGGSMDLRDDDRIVYKLAYDEWEWALRREVVLR